jgi:hypothetical protein
MHRRFQQLERVVPALIAIFIRVNFASLLPLEIVDGGLWRVTEEIQSVGLWGEAAADGAFKRRANCCFSGIAAACGGADEHCTGTAGLRLCV